MNSSLGERIPRKVPSLKMLPVSVGAMPYLGRSNRPLVLGLASMSEIRRNTERPRPMTGSLKRKCPTAYFR